MTKVSKEMIKIRIELLKQMHKYMIEMGDDYLYEGWIVSGVPDCPSDDDYHWIAEDDDEWLYTCSLFGKLAREDIKENY